MSIKIGIIGCGNRMHRLLDIWNVLGTAVEIAALYDPSVAAMQRYQRDFNCADADCCDSYEAVLADPEISWVLIGSINSVHAEQCVAAFRAGKDVFCEKPIAINLKQCQALKAAHSETGRQLMIGFTLRYAPHYQKIKQLLDDGAVGQIISLEYNETLEFNHGGYIAGNWRRFNEFGGSFILEKCCHDIDICNWMVGSRLAKVASFGGLNFFTPENVHHIQRIGPNPKGEAAYLGYHRKPEENPFLAEKDIIDNQVCIAEFENQVRATFHANINAAIPERRLYIMGSEGSIRADLLTGKIEVAKIGWDKTISEYNGEALGGHGGGDEILVDHLYQMMSAGAPSRTSLAAGIEAAVTCFAFQEAMESNSVIDLRGYWTQLG